MREQVERLRASGGLKCSQAVAQLLQEVSPKTIDRLPKREREVRCFKKHRRPPVHPLLYQRVPVKTSADRDRREVGNLQLDYVLHCGAPRRGISAHPVSHRHCHRMVGGITTTGAIPEGDTGGRLMKPRFFKG